MSDAENDPALLFSPVEMGKYQSSELGERLKSPTPDALVAHTRQENGLNSARFVVEVPTLTSEEKEKYEDPDWDDSDSDDIDSGEIVELVGEHKSGNKLYLFARHKDGIIRRKEAWEYKVGFPGLYDSYYERKAEGTLEPFDPSASYVHPKDRIGLVINISRQKGRSRHVDEYVDESEVTSESSEEDEEDDDEYKGRSTRYKSKRVSNHVKKRPSRNLPFSPVRTRTRTGARGAAISLVEDSEDTDEEHAPARRSKRAQPRKNYAVVDDSDFEMLEPSDEGETEVSRKKKIFKRRGPKPAYGRVRGVADMYDSDPETAPLRAHRDICEKCRRQPAHILMKGKKKGRRKSIDDLSDEEEENFSSLGGWVRCLKCCVAAHWSCLGRTQRDEIAKAARARADAETKDGDEPMERFYELDVDESTEFLCGSCAKGGICIVCRKVALEPEKVDADLDGKEKANIDTNVKSLEPSRENLFRCFTCKRLAHYSCLSVKDGEDLEPAEVARVFQEEYDWQCVDCVSYIFPLDKIIAWRPSPPDAVDPYVNSDEVPNIKEHLPREYLVKWVGRSYRRTEWVPHMWLTTTHGAKLKNFYTSGPKFELLGVPVEDGQAIQDFERGTGVPLLSAEVSRAPSAEVEVIPTLVGPPKALPDAELRIPPLWKTVDRVLDVLLWRPRKSKSNKGKRSIKEADDEEHEDNTSLSPEAATALWETYQFGSEPPANLTETTEEFEKRAGRKLAFGDVHLVVWAFIKWDDLPYDEATWDSPPRSSSPAYAAFERAFKYFLLSRSVVVKKMSGKEVARFEARNGQNLWDSDFLGIPEGGNYDIGQSDKLQLMPFQLAGVNWLCRNWFHHQQCILADEMGLGKTVQIITFLGLLHAKLLAFPALVVVPNSTITNWVREFERWAPRLRVVPFYGDQKSREIVKNYELFHSHPEAGTTGAKYHVLVTTYETVTGQKDFTTVFKRTPRWEVLVVDEGQRLKSDTNLIFKRLNELNSCHRIIMTGTPLNNNIRELFNLMNFLDPDEWDDLEGLTKQYEELNEDLVKDLHERLRPYFLRRVKAEVLTLPPKNEVIVPLSMTALQKEIYKSILSKNLAILRSLSDSTSSRVDKSVASKSNLRNMLMQLRKCLQHPYLISDDIEPKGLSPVEAHSKLISASAKLRFLKLLLPKLKERGHRVLLFSQFVIALNIIEDFLQGEGYKFLRLDGDVKQAERQKGMDEFNREGSDIFIYILSTRAGGVGINLWSADTVIIFDPDFNPQQDLQAIARAHRFGQKKTCLVFKLMVKDSAEEKIIQAGKKKLILNHLIVQKISQNEEGDDVQSILTFGAKALFDESNQEDRDINYTEQDVEKLIEKTELEGDQSGTTEASNDAFAFAKVWSSHKDALDEMPDELSEADQDDTWAQTLAKIQKEQQREKSQEKSGRGVRRKATQLKTAYFDGVSPQKKGKKRRKSAESDSSDAEFKPPKEQESISDEDEGSIGEVSNPNTDDDSTGLIRPRHPISSAMAGEHRTPSSVHNRRKQEECALCFTVHGEEGCFMTQKSENLAEYRRMLLESSGDEAYEDRVDAIRTIDETLMKRGHSHLVAGQPLKPVKKRKKLSDFTSLIGEKASEGVQSRKTTAVRPAHSGNQAAENVRASKITAVKPVQLGEKVSENVQERETFFSPNYVHTTFVPFVPYRPTHVGNVRPATSITTGSSSSVSVNQAARRSGACVICGQNPYHLPTACPVVARGPESLTKAIIRLTKEGGNQEIIPNLRSILWKQLEKKPLESAQAGHMQMSWPS